MRNRRFDTRNRPFIERNFRFAERNFRFAARKRRFGARNEMIAARNLPFDAPYRPFGARNRPFAARNRRFDGRHRLSVGQNARFGLRSGKNGSLSRRYVPRSLWNAPGGKNSSAQFNVYQWHTCRHGIRSHETALQEKSFSVFGKSHD